MDRKIIGIKVCYYLIKIFLHNKIHFKIKSIIESVDSISKDERGFPLTQYITNGRISRGGYTFTHLKTPPSCSTADFL